MKLLNFFKFPKEEIRTKLDSDDKVKLKISNFFQLVAYLLDYHPIKTFLLLAVLIGLIVLLQFTNFEFGKLFDMVKSIFD